MFSGMMVGAWAWGSFSDSFGRTAAFNGTLLLTSIFGIMAGFATSFPSLCLLLFGLGVGVGGSMPTDGTLFLENIPKGRHYLLTALATFFSLGAVLTSVLGLIIIPVNSCLEHPLLDGQGQQIPCDVESQNTGWKIQLRVLGGLTLAMYTARVLFFRLYESPKWLVGAGRDNDAVVALQQIVNANGNPLSLSLNDVVDHLDQVSEATYTPVPASEGQAIDSETMTARGEIRLSSLPGSIAQPVEAYINHVARLFRPAGARTTAYIWLIWFLVSAGYTIFNVFLPRWLEYKLSDQGEGSRQDSLRDYALYSLAGCPGSIVGAYIGKSKLGQKHSMVFSTLGTAFGILCFVPISSQVSIVLISMWISFMSTITYALLYSFTPQVFPVPLRGTGCGIASALSRLAGIIVPILTGSLLMLSVSLPLFVSIMAFAASAVFMYLVPQKA